MEQRSIAFQIRCVHNLVKRFVDTLPIKQQMDSATGLHGWIIGYLYHQQGVDVYQRDLETQFQIRRSTASGILRLMENNGLIRREPVVSDARLKRIVLTDKAIQLHRLAQREFLLIEERITHGISEEELSAFAGTLQKMKHNLENQEDPTT